MAAYVVFDRLPLEASAKTYDFTRIRQEIGHCLENDQDLSSYARTCQSTYEAIEQDSGSFWHRRFMQAFDNPGWTPLATRFEDNMRFRQQYTLRRIDLAQPADFIIAQTRREQRQIGMLFELIVQSFSRPVAGTSTGSKNLPLIIDFINSSLLHTPYRPARANGSDMQQIDRLVMLQCILAPAVLGKIPCQRNVRGQGQVYRFRASQAAAFETPQVIPLFNGPFNSVVNGHLVLDILNCFKQWLQYDAPFRPVQDFYSLPPNELPSFWKKILSNVIADVASHWKGTYGCLDEGGHFYPEQYGCSEHLQDITFEAVARDSHYWPAIFETHLRTVEQPSIFINPNIGRESGRCSFFEGKYLDQGDSSRVSARISCVPSQAGVPGWRRFEMMKYRRIGVNGPVDERDLVAYEGVVIPGDRIIVGRWWHAGNVAAVLQSGPFLLWAVDT